MVAAHDFGVYLGVFDLLEQALGGDEVVDAPSGVLLAGTEAVTPPWVSDLLGIEGAEGVDEAFAEQGGEFLREATQGKFNNHRYPLIIWLF